MKPESHEIQILRDLQSGVRITAIDALNRYGCARLASRISQLRKDGFNIQREMVDVPTRNGRGAKVAQYFMTPDVKPKHGADFIGSTPAFL